MKVIPGGKFLVIHLAILMQSTTDVNISCFIFHRYRYILVSVLTLLLDNNQLCGYNIMYVNEGS